MKHKTVYLQNKKAFFNYEILETLEAGIELVGHEVKAVKGGHGSLDGAYVVVRGGEAFLIKARISPYQQKNTPNDYDDERPRKLILHKKEILKLADEENGRGQTIVAIALYNNGGKIKAEIGVAKGKKKFDKRLSIKTRETNIEIRREFKR
jgi:SsrA-binding protein